MIASHQGRDEDEIVKKVTAFIINELHKELDLQVSNHAEREIQYRLRAYKKTSPDEKGLIAGFNSIMSNVDVSKIYSKSKTLFEDTVNQKNLETALRIYNRKSLPDRISSIFGLRQGEYVPLVCRLLKGSEKIKLVSALQSVLPRLGH